MRTILCAGLALLAAAGPTAAWAQPAEAESAQQVLRGQRLYLRCVACHEPGEPKVAKVGPHLKGIVGRRAGGVSGFNYSKGLASAGFTWDDARLLAWLERPTAMVPDTTMVFEGMPVEADRRAMLAYLRTLR